MGSALRGAMVSKDTLKTDVWDALKTYLKTTNPISTSNIFSAMNSTLVKNSGYPMVIIYPPLVSFDKISANPISGNRGHQIDTLIEVYTTSAESVKTLSDEVTSTLLEGTKTFAGQGLKRMNIDQGAYDFWAEGEKKTIHRISFTVSFYYTEAS